MGHSSQHPIPFLGVIVQSQDLPLEGQFWVFPKTRVVKATVPSMSMAEVPGAWKPFQAGKHKSHTTKALQWILGHWGFLGSCQGKWPLNVPLSHQIRNFLVEISAQNSEGA